jgi:polyisoprenoid-binding protein YceI
MSLSRSARRFLTAALVVSSASFAAWVQQGEAAGTFRATGPAGFKIEGSVNKVEVKGDDSTITLAFKLADLTTGIGLRDRHMLEDLEAEKAPQVSLTVPLTALKIPTDGQSVEADARGTFGLHGKTKEIPFRYKASCKAEVCDIEGSADINLKDYDVKVRSYMGITVKPAVSVAMKFRVKK